jgi:hypothetical protein
MRAHHAGRTPERPARSRRCVPGPARHTTPGRCRATRTPGSGRCRATCTAARHTTPGSRGGAARRARRRGMRVEFAARLCAAAKGHAMRLCPPARSRAAAEGHATRLCPAPPSCAAAEGHASSLWCAARPHRACSARHCHRYPATVSVFTQARPRKAIWVLRGSEDGTKSWLRRCRAHSAKCLCLHRAHSAKCLCVCRAHSAKCLCVCRAHSAKCV